jgi:hypothetical protein
VIGGFRDRYRSLTNGNTQATFHFASGFAPKVHLNLPVDPSGYLFPFSVPRSSSATKCWTALVRLTSFTHPADR